MKRFNNFILSVLLEFLFCIILSSCENFLNGDDIKNQINEAIEIANTNPVSFYVEAEEGSGTVTPTQLRLKKKESFELRYKPASSWRFIKWEVRDRNTKEVVTDVIQFDDETALETKGKLLVSRDGLEIYAKAVIIPEVVNVVPDLGSTNNCYEPIVITFNTPVDDSDATETGSVFNYENILITSNGRNVSSYFEKPYFNNNKTVLTILPKAKDIYDYLSLNNQTVFDIRVTLSDRIVVTQGGQEVGITQNSNTNFVLHYRPVLETKTPEQVGDLIVSRKQIKKENVEDFPENDKFFKLPVPKSPTFPKDEEVMRNRIVNKIYIYGKYIDDDSGITSVSVKEVREYNNNGSDSDTLSDTIRPPVKYTADNAVFIHDGKFTEFFIEHEVMTKTGAIKLDITVYDACGNEASDSLYAFKVGSDSYEDFNLSNNTRVDYFDATYNESIKTLVIRDVLSEKIYYGDNHNVDPSKFKIYCLYNNKTLSSETQFTPYSRTITVSPDFSFQDEGWEYKLNVPSVAGLDFTIVIIDDIENIFQKSFSFPSEPVVVVSGPDEDSQKAYIYLYPSENISEYSEYTYDIIDSRDGGEYNIRAFQVSRGYPEGNGNYLDSGLEYWIVPKYSDEHDCRCNLSGAVSSKSFKVNAENNGNLSEIVSLKIDPQFTIVPDLRKAEVSFTLADNSWQTFDLIYYDMSFGTYNWKTVIPKGTFLVKENLPYYYCNELYTNDITLNIYGIKNGQKSDPLEKTIITSQDSDGNPVTSGTYDINPPEKRTDKRKSSYEYRFSFSKGSNIYETDLDSLYLIERNGNEKLLQTLSPSSSGSIDLPVTMLEAEADDSGIWRIKATDKAGNARIIEYSKTIIDHYKINSLEKSGTKWKVNMRRPYIDSLDLAILSEGKWNETSIKSRDLIATISYFSPDSAGAFDIPADSFVKISYISTRGASELCEYNYAYFYANTTAKSSGDFDYIEKRSDSEFFITSDAPALVHTIKTKAPYSECKNWTEYDWEGHLAPLNDKAYNFSGSDHVPRKYQVPLDEINSGECYVVITYFANSENNRPLRLVPHISEVMIKP